MRPGGHQCKAARTILLFPLSLSPLHSPSSWQRCGYFNSSLAVNSAEVGPPAGKRFYATRIHVFRRFDYKLKLDCRLNAGTLRPTQARGDSALGFRRRATPLDVRRNPLPIVCHLVKDDAMLIVHDLRSKFTTLFGMLPAIFGRHCFGSRSHCVSFL